MAFVMGNLVVRNLAADLLAAVLDHPQNVIREARQIEASEVVREGSEEWDLLTAVAVSLRESSTRGDIRQPEAEIHLLRHLATRQ
jgi:hypothetical protein